MPASAFLVAGSVGAGLIFGIGYLSGRLFQAFINRRVRPTIGADARASALLRRVVGEKAWHAYQEEHWNERYTQVSHSIYIPVPACSYIRGIRISRLSGLCYPVVEVRLAYEGIWGYVCIHTSNEEKLPTDDQVATMYLWAKYHTREFLSIGNWQGKDAYLPFVQ